MKRTFHAMCTGVLDNKTAQVTINHVLLSSWRSTFRTKYDWTPLGVHWHGFSSWLPHRLTWKLEGIILPSLEHCGKGELKYNCTNLSDIIRFICQGCVCGRPVGYMRPAFTHADPVAVPARAAAGECTLINLNLPFKQHPNPIFLLCVKYWCPLWLSLS